MENIVIETMKDGLVIRVVFNGQGTPSASGKTLVLASTHGNVAVDVPGMGIVHVGLNVYRRP